MKRNLVIASITAAALIGGGTYTAVAMGATDSGADAAPKSVSSASLVNGADAASDDDRDDRDDRNEPNDDRDDNGGSSDNANGKDDTSAAGSKLTAAQVAAAALKQHPGKVESVDLDDGDDDGSSVGRHWEVDIIGQDGKWYDLRVDASTGAVRADNDNDNDDDDDRNERAAVRGAKVDAQGAAAAALKKHPGAVTSIDSDDDDSKADHWEVTVRGDDGSSHGVTVDMSSGTVAADRDDSDDHGDDDGRDDDSHDDRGDDDHGDDGDDD